MKIALITFLTLVGMHSLSTLTAGTFVADFLGDPSYTEGSTIVDDDHGWVSMILDSENNSDASVVAEEQGKSLRILSTSTSRSLGQRRTTVRNIFAEKVDGPSVTAKLGIGWNSIAATIDQSAGISFGAQDYNVPTTIAFSRSKGIHITSGDGEIQLLSGELIKSGFLYTFVVIFNYESRTFDLSMKGIDIDERPVDVVKNEIPFASGVPANTTGIKGLFLFTYRGDATEFIVGSINLASAHE